jgi:hypothetical protein
LSAESESGFRNFDKRGLALRVTWPKLTVMKTFQYNPGKFLMIAVVCSFAASATIQAGPFSASSMPTNGAVFTDNARLFVWRAADFGTVIYLNLFIDGVQVTTLGRNEGYEAIVRPGRHVLSIGTSPCSNWKAKLTHRRVTLNRGQTYSFTALWEEADVAVLEMSDEAKHASQARW